MVFETRVWQLVTKHLVYHRKKFYRSRYETGSAYSKWLALNRGTFAVIK